MTKEAEKLGNESAIPEVYTNAFDHISSTNGLSKREFFAAMAMQGIISNASIAKITDSYKDVAEWSIEHADALLEELCKTDKT